MGLRKVRIREGNLANVYTYAGLTPRLPESVLDAMAPIRSGVYYPHIDWQYCVGLMTVGC